jgi:nicotinamide mononucleotide adenylyltransferase
MLKEVVKTSKCQKLLIGIGDSGIISERNFLKANEVKELMELILKELKINFEIKIIRDLNNPPKYGEWVEKIFSEINEKNCVLYTENDYTKDCFINYGHNYEVKSPTLLPNKATKIRELMMKDRSEWEDLVPKNILDYIKTKDLILRLKSLKI